MDNSIKVVLSNGDTAFQDGETQITYNREQYEAYEAMDGSYSITVDGVVIYIVGEVYNSPVHGEVNLMSDFCSDLDFTKHYIDHDIPAGIQITAAYIYLDWSFIESNGAFIGFLDNKLHCYATLDGMKAAIDTLQPV